MKIYELIYYWDDCAYGCDISNTILVKSQEEVEKLKAEFYKVSQSTITNCCNPKYRTKTACGFIFSYNKIITQSSVIPISLKPINQYDLNMNLIKTWSSRKEFQKEFPNWRISECLNGKNKSCNNYIFKYVDENNTLENPFIEGNRLLLMELRINL